jgi:hypothetical protein
MDITPDLTAHQSNHEASNHEIFIQAAKGYQIIGPMGDPMVLINPLLMKWRTWKVMGCNSLSGKFVVHCYCKL